MILYLLASGLAFEGNIYISRYFHEKSKILNKNLVRNQFCSKIGLFKEYALSR